MSYKKSKDHLVKQGLIKRCPVDKKSVDNLIGRAKTDLITARRNLNDDEECAYNYAYNAMMRSGLAVMFSDGYRPEIKDKHLTIVKYVSCVMGDELEKIINSYDYMRKKRNHFLYEPDVPCSMTEAEEALRVAGEFVSSVEKIIGKKR